MKSIINRFEAYLLTERRLALNTVKAYTQDIDDFRIFMRESKPEATFQTISIEEIREYLAHLKLTLKLSPRSMARKISTFRVFYTYVHKFHDIPDIAQELSSPTIEQRLPNYLSEEEVYQLITFIKEDTSPVGIRNHVMLTLLYASGMRISEMVSLEINQIQFDTSFVTVHGKGGKSRLVPLPKDVTALIKEYLEKAHPYLIKVSYNAQESQKKNNAHRVATTYLFPTMHQGKIKTISRQAFWYILTRVARESGLKRSLSPHVLRHSLATHLLHKGADLRSLQLLLGHENLATVQIYTHLDTKHLREMYDKRHPRAL